jgi:asparagine synthase (glutamine-hydrolysing)
MCGIAASLSTDDPDGNAARVRRMLFDLAHRGDQPPALAATPYGMLGCVRLAIVDRTPAAAQPVWNERRTVAVVFNGEVYNWRELVAELTARGHQFRTRTDTEVLAHGYEEWGNELPARLEGMFAFVAVDLTTGRHLAARDPFGIKPLYYSVERERVSFASEIRPLLRSAGQVREVPPGGRMINGRLAVADEPPLPPLPPFAGTLQEGAAEVRHLLRRAVDGMMPDDLPTAILCGGGLDSSAVLYEAARSGREVYAYVIGVDRAASDMRAAVDLCHHLRTTYRLRVELREVLVTPEELLRSVPAVVRTIESFEPNHIRGGTLSYALGRRMQADGIKVALCGEGADELFAGYPEFLDCLTDDDPAAELRRLERQFVRQLHRTQLQRVDRTSMAFGVEVRVPYLNGRLAEFARSLPLRYKLDGDPGRRGSLADTRVKVALREAYRDVLPSQIANRRKIVLSEGAGMGDNSPGGPFADYADRLMSDTEYARLKADHPEFDVRSKEEAVYLDTFLQEFGRLSLATDRPLVNARPTKG